MTYEKRLPHAYFTSFQELVTKGILNTNEG